MPDRVLVTGGAGYIGAMVCAELLDAGADVRVLDSLLHGQQDVAQQLAAQGVEVQVGDVRDPAARARALEGAGAVVHLAAIVGDHACAADPALSGAVNLDAANAVIDEAARAGVRRFVFASTCSNYGRMADPEVPVDEDAELRPVSLYAEQKVAIERRLLGGDRGGGPVPPATCLRFATIYGVAPRMRFDLTVNEFTRDLWLDRDLEIFGEQFWRPYLHVADAGRAVRTVLGAPDDVAAGEVFNVGRSDENYTKRHLVEAIARQVAAGRVHYVQRDEDPRDYRVAFEKVHAVLGFVPEHRVPDGIAEVAEALAEGRFPDPFDVRYRNTV
ncbi:NAD-dependent epimerase/dehydratase family protein [Capillimicrobium parvum]|uniref:UDP-glucose 4-epimerase n=1 Tax=Capillimicrobium parvum TaxID=2884022 RepID=A0A9E6Y2R5_9ACTN|nr:NAD(P)-dependent oxidoreductase [Capillimicrobium parvum]UGS38838.1 UDP-glucose 4-epimerase [Capillimicrobium parvum]